jgi:hypothetical protein
MLQGMLCPSSHCLACSSLFIVAVLLHCLAGNTAEGALARGLQVTAASNGSSLVVAAVEVEGLASAGGRGGAIFEEEGLDVCLMGEHVAQEAWLHASVVVGIQPGAIKGVAGDLGEGGGPAAAAA